MAVTLWSVYAAGVAIGLAAMRDRWATRVVTAMMWPLGPAAFLVVVPSLLLAATVLWPLRMLTFFAVVAALFWFLT